MTEADIQYMRRAIALAEAAAKLDEVPVGALVVHRGEIIAEAFNTRERDKCASSHAELRAIEAASRALGGWRLPDCTLYVTLEPCPMCAGAILHARIDRVVYGARDGRAGSFGSAIDLNALPLFRTAEVEGGVLGEECASLLSDYFKAKRKPKSPADGL